MDRLVYNGQVYIAQEVTAAKEFDPKADQVDPKTIPKNKKHMYTKESKKLFANPGPNDRVEHNPEYDHKTENTYAMKSFPKGKEPVRHYTKEYVLRNKAKNFVAVDSLSPVIPKIRATYSKGLKSKDRGIRYRALSVALADQSWIRVGDTEAEEIGDEQRKDLKSTSEADKKELAKLLKNESPSKKQKARITELKKRISKLDRLSGGSTTGMTTLKVKNVKLMPGNKVKLSFPAKDLVQHTVIIQTDKVVFGILKELVTGKKPGDYLFQWEDDAGNIKRLSPAHVNKYFKVDCGSPVSIHKLRNFNATATALDILTKDKPSAEDRADPKALAKHVKAILEPVMQKLGHTSAKTSLSYYIDVKVLGDYFKKWKTKMPQELTMVSEKDRKKHASVQKKAEVQSIETEHEVSSEPEAQTEKEKKLEKWLDKKAAKSK